MTKDEILLAHQNHLFPAVFHYFRRPLVLVRAKNQHVWDANGNQYLDFFGGIVTISVGHANDRVNRAVHEQVDRLSHVSTVFATEPQAALAAKIAALTPDGRLTKSFFSNSGTEANEMAVLAARCATGSSEIVALRHSYHGRSTLGMSLTGVGSWRLGGATLPGIVHAHNAYCYRSQFGATYPACDLACARDVEELIRTTTPGRIAGFIAEPIQGVGGFITPPQDYFRVVAEIVRRHGGLFISDEVQTAWGRTGNRWFGIEHYGVVPDILTSAKGLGNGLPIAVTVATPEVADRVRGLTISTFGGNPVTTAAARAVIEFIEEEKPAAQHRPKGRPAAPASGSAEGEAPPHRRRARHGPVAGPRAGARPRHQGAGAGGNRRAHGGGARPAPAGGERRPVRQRHPPEPAHEHRPRRRRGVRAPARRRPGPGRSRREVLSSVFGWMNARFTSNPRQPGRPG
jgi:4-aminobutyrate aminotransferase